MLAVMSAMAVLSYFRFIRTEQEALAADLPVGFPQQRAVADPE